MFAQLALSPMQVSRMRSEHGVYMAGSGRINLAGLIPETVGAFAKAYETCLVEEYA